MTSNSAPGGPEAPPELPVADIRRALLERGYPGYTEACSATDISWRHLEAFARGRLDVSPGNAERIAQVIGYDLTPYGIPPWTDWRPLEDGSWLATITIPGHGDREAFAIRRDTLTTTLTGMHDRHRTDRDTFQLKTQADARFREFCRNHGDRTLGLLQHLPAATPAPDPPELA